MKRKRIDPAKFTAVWQASKSAQEAGKQLKITGLEASAFATRLRKRGVAVKRMPRGSCYRLDVAALNAIVHASKRKAK